MWARGSSRRRSLRIGSSRTGRRSWPWRRRPRRITAGGKTKDGNRLSNGSLLTIQGFNKRGDIIVDHGRVIDRDFGHLTHGYCITSHASQGVTVDKVFVGVSSQSFPATYQRTAYVALTRGKEQALVFTDDRNELLKAVSRADDPMSATELSESHAAETEVAGSPDEAVWRLLAGLACLGRQNLLQPGVARDAERNGRWTMADDKLTHQDRLQKNPPPRGSAGFCSQKRRRPTAGKSSCGAFGYLRGIRDQATSVEFRFRNGNSTWFPYGWMGPWQYNPSEGLLLKFSGDLVYLVLIQGSNLHKPVKEGAINLTHAGLQRHRVLWIREMSEEEIRQVGEMGPTIDSIEVAEFESHAELKEWLSRKPRRLCNEHGEWRICMNEADAALAAILADCATDDDLTRQIRKHAIIVQHLVCYMGKSADTTEAAIRTLYDTWADMAVEEFKDPGTFLGRKYH